MMNDTYKGFFKSARGLLQGDHLSLYLFILMEEVLTRLLKKGFEDGQIGQFFHPRSAPIISHLLYADDLIFVNGGKGLVKALLRTLEKYERWLGQSVNKTKYAFSCQRRSSLTSDESLSVLLVLLKVNHPPNILGLHFTRVS